MHLLNAQSGAITDGSEPIDLQQSPGDIVVLTNADTEIAALARAQALMPDGAPRLRLASLLQLNHNYSVDLYIEQTLRHARLIVIRLLGGPGYWPYGLDEVTALARGHDIKLAVIPGDMRPDPSLAAYSTLGEADCAALFSYFLEGGPENMRGFLSYGGFLLGKTDKPAPAQPLPKAALYRRNEQDRREHAPGKAAIIFYRTVLQSGDLAPVDALIEALGARGMAAEAWSVTSLKDPDVASTIKAALSDFSPDVMINLTAFALRAPGSREAATVLDDGSRPVIQAILAGQSEAAWADSAAGLGPRDIAMNVALPEIDGRIISRAISFKAKLGFDEKTEASIIGHAPKADRVDFVAALAARWSHLRNTPRAARKVALILANYPTSDGRIANGVGLDTPASTMAVLRQLKETGYRLERLPETAEALMQQLQQRADATAGRLDLADYRALLETHLPACSRAQVTARWGPPEDDPEFDRETRTFLIRGLLLGHVVVGVQPARGFEIDPKATHHDPELVPPHNYLAFYFWLRQHFAADAIIHMGKHGNLEWLPGKALALSQSCFPDAVFGPIPHLYPFIVNDPGEGSQAKRRLAAVIIDHLTPPLTRAETYGPLKDLEALVDEYFEAANVDPRRLDLLGRQILDLAHSHGLAKECGIYDSEGEISALQKIDNFLCELKELQIRGGLHVFGTAPKSEQLTDLLVALARTPRGDGQAHNASLIRALADDLGLTKEHFDPLDCEMAAPWTGPRPERLAGLLTEDWRSFGDTVERLELLARALVAGDTAVEAGWSSTVAVLDEIEQSIRPRVAACGGQEMRALLAGLDGRFVAAGPSGAPTRGRLDTLPTGRNFYAIDNRTVPTKAAWELGQLSAERLITAYRQEHGRWPQAMGISAWGTANMRTGGDDIAQALALIGARPVWEEASRRVTGFEIISLSDLRRPRVDVLFRISGFFRDAFPGQIDLLDSAIAAVADCDEPDDANPLRARYQAAESGGPAPRIFGTRPGGYGAGVQHLIETSTWDNRAELAESYLATSAYSYGGGRGGKADGQALREAAARLDAVVQNQDAREFDLLDSDDYYQFEGGLAAAVEALSGTAPSLYHNDHSRPQSPQIRSLETEIAQILRARAVNPKWLAAMKQHGYKGASELAQTVTNLFGFASLTNAVASHQFDLVFEAYILDDDTRGFLETANPAALQDIASRLLEAETRQFWQPKRNSAHDFLIEISGKY